VQPDGQVLIGGGFTTVQGLNRSGIARLNANGNLDGSFNVTLDSDDPDYYPPGVVSIAVQSDRKVLIGGSFSAVNGTNVPDGLARLNADGSLDSSFNPGVSGSVSSITLLPDGEVLIGGGFIYNYINATNYSCGLARLNADGSLDSSFNSGRAVLDVSSVALQPDGKVLVGGAFPGHGIARLNADGSLDGTFNGGAAVSVFGYVSSVALQSDGKVLVGGGFSEVNGSNRNAIARLNANGTLDENFTPDLGINFSDYPVVGSLVVQTDGRVFVGGSFSTVNGTNRNGIARLNANGSLDVSFNPGAGVTGGDYPLVKSIVVQSNGNVLIGGSFTTVNGAARPQVARLYGDSVAPSLNIARSGALMILSWPVTALSFQLQENTDLSLPNSWSPVAQAAVTNDGQISVTVPTVVGSRFFRLKSR
jgi:uncharacterized delta-60 repeat protein